MADDTRDSNQNNPAPASTEQPGSVDSTQPAKKFPKGVVLGKDGKPYVPSNLHSRLLTLSRNRLTETLFTTHS